MRKTKRPSRCAVTRGEIDLTRYSSRDTVWRSLGLAAPARRALVDAKILTLASLARRTRSSIGQLHGMGPYALGALERALRKAGLAFRD